MGARGLEKMHGTTILAVRHGGRVAIGGDGQVTLGNTIMKADALKVRRLAGGPGPLWFRRFQCGCLALLERFESFLKDFPGNLPRAATELAKQWRTDRALRRLEAFLAAADARHLLLLSGTGDIIQPSDGVIGIGSGGPCAVAAARALIRHSPLSAGEIVRQALLLAAELDIYTNDRIVVEELECVEE